MERENRQFLIEGAKGFGIHLDDKTIEAFDQFLRELLKWNQKINLTAIRSEKGIVLNHFLDSLSVHPYLPEICTLLDVGSGAGFPGIPLKIVQTSLEVISIDSTRKKIDFQRHIVRVLGLKGIEPIHGRTQDKEILWSMRGQFDIVISRAFSDLRTLLILSFPFLKTGGKVLAMKGNVSSEEILHLHEIEGTPYRLQKTVPFVLPFSDFKRTILLFGKE